MNENIAYTSVLARMIATLSESTNRIVPALLVAVLGGAVQYLADIRWALLKKLEGSNA